MSGLLEGRVVAITGAGRGIGRAHALLCAEHGASVVVNDLGAQLDGGGTSAGPAGEVVDEIQRAGGDAVANNDDCADWEGAQRLVQTAIDNFGRLDVMVANAGILRDRMLVNMTIEDWDAVMRVHLRGTFCSAHWAAVHWRERSKGGEEVDARLITTSSAAGLYGNIGQANYSAAKAGIAAFTRTVAAELERYGVTANAVAPAARTRMTETLFADVMKPPEEGFDAMAPENNSPIIAWLASKESKGVTARIFETMGGQLGIAEGYRHGPVVKQDGPFDPTKLGSVVEQLLAEAAQPTALLGAS
ncbi:MAG TPA: SDR family oxidoreductase [Candidatus Dormibacteraeota bacterium]|jgi:NAD(P)-dependent dehydrogenase (short-subunit alcohol dehydrogenase family)|nr:SDR family oxidoreductase [Candidatus Dormibacteraeota bacterium]